MTEQEKLEKVIKGLGCCMGEGQSYGMCDDCPYTTGKMVCNLGTLHQDALELLKAQEPRVLTLDEYKVRALTQRCDKLPVWIEWRDGGYGWAIPQRAYEGYGTRWRAWTDRTTDAQREAVKWE